VTSKDECTHHYENGVNAITSYTEGRTACILCGQVKEGDIHPEIKAKMNHHD